MADSSTILRPKLDVIVNKAGRPYGTFVNLETLPIEDLYACHVNCKKPP